MSDLEVANKIAQNQEFMNWAANSLDSLEMDKEETVKFIPVFNFLAALFKSKHAPQQIISYNIRFPGEMFLKLSCTYHIEDLLHSHLKALKSFTRHEISVEGIQQPTSIEILIGIASNTKQIELKQEIYRLLQNFLFSPPYIKILKDHNILDNVRNADSSS
jgi:hypothetical protein